MACQARTVIQEQTLFASRTRLVRRRLLPLLRAPRLLRQSVHIVYRERCLARISMLAHRLLVLRLPRRLLLLLRVPGLRRRLVQLVRLVGRLVITNMWEPRSFALQQQQQRRGLQRRLLLLRVLELLRRSVHIV